MAAYYSNFFSSGLLNVDSDVHQPHTPEPTTPRAFATNVNDDTTPTASKFGLPASQSSNDTIPSLLAQTEAITINGDRPRMRRRRSSMGLSSSPVTPLKGTPPSRAATVHLQRQSMPMGVLGVASPARSRSGSITESISFTRSAMSSISATSDPAKAGSLLSRMRSGSVGNALRSNSRRRKPNNQTPAPPPPNAPLPAPPQLRLPPTALDLSNIPSVPRRPSARRAATSDSLPLLVHTPSIPIPGPGARLTPYADGAACSPLARSWAHDADGASDMEDYPVPLDTPGEVRGEYFA
ncbi:hypothetical protein PsYK624_007510 [Phanerochaete sordida]|uniref:Uncharacterized protein n=1 Tax=Phanerochaete sordida TaxID=48140 RepID=A0A9P3FYU1_9APHY|nr:hypothetical protein PsYK624_007510 [Phanerochaete sordida]